MRRKHPRMGVKKLYGLIKPDLQQIEGATGRDKFFDILGSNNLLIKRRKKYVTTTNSWHHFHKYNNKLNNTLLTGSGQAFASDITYLRTQVGFVYLFLQTDVYSRMITGWHLSNSLSIDGAVSALKMTIKQCGGKTKGSIHHSDRGIQYCCKEYVKLLQQYEMEISMTEENHCYENAMAERVNGILKQEYLLDGTFADYTSAFKAVKEAIDSYNQRPHWSLNLLTPKQVHNAA